MAEEEGVIFGGASLQREWSYGIGFWLSYVFLGQCALIVGDKPIFLLKCWDSESAKGVVKRRKGFFLEVIFQRQCISIFHFRAGLYSSALFTFSNSRQSRGLRLFLFFSSFTFV